MDEELTVATTVAKVAEAGKQVARPLHILVPLIKKDLADATEAADNAAKPFFVAAGEKLAEAWGPPNQRRMSNSEFEGWAKRNFNIGRTQAKLYVSYAATFNPSAAAPFSSLEDFQRSLGRNRSKVTTQPWHEPIKETLNRVDVATLNIRQDELKRAEARLAKRQLALQLIDIGYKALATKLHPDKGGSREAMARLNEVRKDLKDFANR